MSDWVRPLASKWSKLTKLWTSLFSNSQSGSSSQLWLRHPGLQAQNNLYKAFKPRVLSKLSRNAHPDIHLHLSCLTRRIAKRVSAQDVISCFCKSPDCCKVNWYSVWVCCPLDIPCCQFWPIHWLHCDLKKSKTPEEAFQGRLQKHGRHKLMVEAKYWWCSRNLRSRKHGN